jgi:hypothetical protein
MKGFFFVLASLLALPAPAQTGVDNKGMQLSTWLKNAYTNTRNNLIKSAEGVPDELYDMRPGPQQEVRTYGQIIGHVANFNIFGARKRRAKRIPMKAMIWKRSPRRPD